MQKRQQEEAAAEKKVRKEQKQTLCYAEAEQTGSCKHGFKCRYKH